jgi:hypothetical protein
MPTNFTIKQHKPAKSTPGGHYVMEREFKKEARKVKELEKELKEHEKTDAAHAHPMHMSHEANQKSAGLPNMRKF